MATYNRVILVGRLTRDVELKNTNSGTAVSSFTLAVNRTPTKNNTEPGADFPKIVTFGKTAEFASNYLGMGSLILVEGRLQTGKYEKSDGTTQYTTDVVADRIMFMEKKSDNRTDQQPYTPDEVQYPEPEVNDATGDDNVPF